MWNARAVLGERAGTQDLIAVELERRAIERHVRDGMRVLDVGCGDGGTAIRLGASRKIGIKGVDSAWAMIEMANRNKTLQPFNQHIEFVCADVEQMDLRSGYDLIYTQRLLINLGTWDRQRAMIIKMLSWLKPGGTLLMVECSQDGLDGVNELRRMVGLPAIVPPSHNRYLRDEEMLGFYRELVSTTGLGAVEPMPLAICSTYALFSRIVNAKDAQRSGTPPKYDSSINKLALDLPNIGDLGQNRLWHWVKA